jgi:hypothetical protein
LTHELSRWARIGAEFACGARLVGAHRPPTIFRARSNSYQTRGRWERANISLIQSRLVLMLCSRRVRVLVAVSMSPLKILQLHWSVVVRVPCFRHSCQQYNRGADGSLLLQESHRRVVLVLSPSARARIAANRSWDGVDLVDLACRSITTLTFLRVCLRDISRLDFVQSATAR